MTITIKDIAKHLGISHSTVSRALNGSSSVNEQTKEKIVKVAEELGYIPNLNARCLKLSKAYNIGVFFSTIDDGTSAFVFQNVINNVYDIIDKRYNVIVKGIDTYERNSINPKNYDGIIVVSQKQEDDDFIREIISKHIPIVVINRKVDFDVINVYTEEDKGTYEGIEYLINSGHKKIGIIEGKNGFDSTNLRRKGYIEAFKNYNISINKDYIASGDFTVKGGYLAANKIINNGITAIFAFNDEMAIGAIKAINDAKLSVPNDISVLGFDGNDFGEYLIPSIATIKRPIGSIANKGTELLMKLINKEDYKEKLICYKSEFIEGDSIKKVTQNYEK